ncbi:MAG: GNAT family N-acetyltransferase [bacterium]|nr:GNAT family N-acetyltransferase [bacterium]
MKFNIIIAKSESEYNQAKMLFREYEKDIGIDLSYQNFKEEIENIVEKYSRPFGGILLVKSLNGILLGCTAIRKFNDESGELKRMFVKKSWRGTGIGKSLLEASIKLARELGYKKVKLDTLSSMQSAIRLYKKLGFNEIEPYIFNPDSDALYFEIEL